MKDDDLLAIDLAAEILHRHLQRLQAARAGQVTIGAGHVGQVADADFVVADFGLRRAGDHACYECGGCGFLEIFHIHPLLFLLFCFG